MPQLVRGHMLYTDADYVWEDFQEMATSRNRTKSRRTLTKILQRKLARLQAQQQQLPTVQILTDMLSVFTALAAKEGYKLSDLVKNDLVKNI